jgi:t-SNARE complex subunit (syntaxin)
MNISDPDRLLDDNISVQISKERTDSLKQIESDCKHLLEIQEGINGIVNTEGQQIDDIENDISNAVSNQQDGVYYLRQAEKSNNRWKWFVASVSGAAAAIVVVATTVTIVRSK